MKKALMIAYFFPPLGGSGVQRTLKFVKYLPQFGILPVVSTVKSGHNFAYDESLLQEVPKEVSVYRSSSLETLWLRQVLDRLASLRSPSEGTAEGEMDSGDKVPEEARTGTEAETDAEIDAEAPEKEINQQPSVVEEKNLNSRDQLQDRAGESPETQPQEQKSDSLAVSTNEPEIERKSLKTRIFEFIDNYIFIPDSKVRWLPFGLIKSLQVARREKVDYLFSSSYPYTVHLIALGVHKFYRKPWIADFRDPWVGNKAMQKEIPFRQKLDAWMERKVVEEADYIINVTPSITEMYQQRYPQYAHKMVTITNGFDPEDFAEITPVEQPKFTLIHTGIIADAYDIESFAEGVYRFIEKYPTARENLQILFIGYVPPHYDELLKQKLEKTYVFLPYMSHQKVLEYLAGAHLQFMTFDQSVDNAYSGKLFDYIGTGKPILGLLPEGVAAQLIRERQLGTVVSLGDAEGLAKVISRYYEAWQGASLTPDKRAEGQAQDQDQAQNAARCDEFSRLNLAGELAKLFTASEQSVRKSGAKDLQG